MPISDLDLILKKDPIITTFPASALRSSPTLVEQSYSAHAKTHLSLGDTARYVDTIFKWVGGGNKGAFIGAVVGNYGEGKTIFLIHVWQNSIARRVFAVPPFEWTRFGELVDAVAGWIRYVLEKTDPPASRRAERLHDEFREKSLEEFARVVAQKTGQPLEIVIQTLTAMEQHGTGLDLELSATRFLDYCSATAEILKGAGYSGLLVLLDEPEIAAKRLGKERVSHFLFQLADELHVREGDYGVFLSMPQNFLADALRRFPSLTARLQARGCFPRLRDIYGPDFARDLWDRYVSAFDLGEEGRNIVSPLALQAIGQVGSSDRSDLSYGPRTVVSAFSRMVFRYRETGTTYQPEDFVRDCLDDEIMIHPDYPSRVREILQSPEVVDANRDAVILLASFPNGLSADVAHQRGIHGTLFEMSRRGTLVYRTAFTFALRKLAKETVVETDPLRSAILDIAGEYAPSRETLARAKAAFVRHVLPRAFQPRSGLLGWDKLTDWSKPRGGAWSAAFVGAFLQTQHQFPRRAVMVVVSALGEALEELPRPDLPLDAGALQYDAVFHFRLRWDPEQETLGQRLEIEQRDPCEQEPGVVRLTIDLQDTTVPLEALSDLVDQETLTPLWLLHLIDRMDGETLPTEFDAQWQAMRKIALDHMIPLFFSEELLPVASEQLGQTVLDSGLPFLGSVFQKMLLKRYPHYSTLIRQPSWASKVGDYIGALNSNLVPLACKRGHQPWKAEGDLAPKAFRTSRMNLTGGAFEGFENLVVISSAGRSAPIEVQFRIHPLEQHIVDLVTSRRERAEGKFTVNGRECWWMPQADLLPIIKQSGYTVEELRKIVEIGVARGSFKVGDRKGEPILYCEPIDLEQMRRQLGEKLSALEREIEEFKKLPHFVSNFDSVAMRQAIAAISDDTGYDRLVTRLNKEFEQLHQGLPAYFDRLGERLRESRKTAKGVVDQLTGAREVAALAHLPSGKSAWCASLGRYITSNLRSAVANLRTEAEALVGDLDQSAARFVFQGAGKPSENVALLIEGNTAAADAETRASEVKQRWSGLMTNLRDYDEWLRVLRRSDEVYESLLQLSSEAAHKGAAESIVADFEALSQDISDHLELRNILGLPAHRQFLSALEEIDERRRKYITGLKAEFDKCKGAVNDLLSALKLDQRVEKTFNPMDIEGCYRELFDEAALHVREAAVDRYAAEVAEQEREVEYARDILNRVDDAEALPVVQRLSDAAMGLEQLRQKATADWIRATADEGGASELEAAIAAIENAFAALRASRQLVGRVSQPGAPCEGRAKLLYDLIPDKGSIDLKVLVLRMMPGLDEPQRALDESLEHLAELFRGNCVRISVERRRL